MNQPTKDTKRKLQLSPEEFVGMRSQIATTADAMRSQFVTTSERRRLTSPPRAFTEHGAIIAANVILKERRASYAARKARP